MAIATISSSLLLIGIVNAQSKVSSDALKKVEALIVKLEAGCEKEIDRFWKSGSSRSMLTGIQVSSPGIERCYVAIRQLDVLKYHIVSDSAVGGAIIVPCQGMAAPVALADIQNSLLDFRRRAPFHTLLSSNSSGYRFRYLRCPLRNYQSSEGGLVG